VRRRRLLEGPIAPALITLAILGLGFGQGPRQGRILLALVVLATASFYSFFFTQTRYRIPVEPQLTVLAALGLERALPGFARWLEGPPPEP